MNLEIQNYKQELSFLTDKIVETTGDISLFLDDLNYCCGDIKIEKEVYRHVLPLMKILSEQIENLGKTMQKIIKNG